MAELSINLITEIHFNMANQSTLIKLRNGAGNWWDINHNPSGEGEGFAHGIVHYGESSGYNYDTTGSELTFHQLSISKGEPWVNNTTKQLWIDNVVINPEIKLTLNGSPVNHSLTFDASTYEVQKVFNISTTDTYLNKVATLEFPTTSAGASDVQDFMVEVLGGQASDYTATLSGTTWTVTWGESLSQTFTAGSDYIGFSWNTGSGISPTWLEVPDTDTHWASKNVVSGSVDGITDTTSALTNGNVFLNHVENNALTDSHGISGTAGIGVTADANANIIIGHTNTAITAGSTSWSLSGNQLTGSSVSYDAYGHITGVTTETFYLPSGGSGSGGSHSFSVSAEVADGVSPTQGFAQAVISESHSVGTPVTTISGTSGQTTVTHTGNENLVANTTLTYNNNIYTISDVNGTTVTISPALLDNIASGETVTWTHPVTSKMFKLQQSGLTSSTLSTYSGTKVSFKTPTGNSDTASNSDFGTTILMNIDVIDGGTFD